MSNPAELIQQFQHIVSHYPHVRRLFPKIQYVTVMEEVGEDSDEDGLLYPQPHDPNSNYYDITLDQSCLMEKRTKTIMKKRTELSWTLSADAIREEFRKLYEQQDSCFKKAATRNDIRHFFENVFYFPFKKLPLEWWVQMKRNIQTLLIVYMVMENELTRIYKTPVSGIPQFLIHLQTYINGLDRSPELEELQKNNEKMLSELPDEWSYMWFNIG